MTSEAKSKTNSLRNILFLTIPTGFLSGVGLERETEETFHNSKLHLFPLVMKFKGLLQMFGVRLQKHGSSHTVKYPSLKPRSLIRMAQWKQRLWSDRWYLSEMKACSLFQKTTSGVFRVPPPTPGFTHCAGVCFPTHDLRVFMKRRMKSSCHGNSNCLCCWCAFGLSSHAKL